MANRRKPRISMAEQRRAREARKGWYLIAISALALIVMVVVSYAGDKAHGVTVAQSLQSAGL